MVVKIVGFLQIPSKGVEGVAQWNKTASVRKLQAASFKPQD
jgi:hypothetical protein